MKTTKATHEPYNVDLFAPIMKETEGNYIAVLSDTSIDRDGERVGKSALQKAEMKGGYTAGLLDHENKVLNQVCSWVNKRIVDIEGHTALVAEPKFFKSNPNAKIIKGMLDEGAEIGISIGAIVKDWKDDKVMGKSIRTFTELELLEASFVAIPANKHGRAMAVVKSYKFMEDKSMSEEKFTQKDVDSALEKKVSEIETDFTKKLESKDNEISELSKKLKDAEKSYSEKEVEKNKAEKSVVEAEKKLEDTEKALSEFKKASLEKQKFADEGNNGEEEEQSEEDVDKAFSEGKLPIMNFAR